jgi:hypothetical protein
MQDAVRFRVVRAAMLPVGVLLCGALFTACASAPRTFGPVSLDTPEVAFSSGKISVFLTDENGLPMVRTRVDFSWQKPEFYKTSAFTDNNGQVTFNGVPEVAEVSIDHPGGNYTKTLVVPQRGISELRVILDTYGENETMRTNQNTPVSLQQRIARTRVICSWPRRWCGPRTSTSWRVSGGG